ncbi:MAG: substrate-binding domain-containing protein [Anaerolineae bacterium]|nr:substrate-binding domain-containing protein [Anaerolineae bacterium]NIQ80308.1 substrate-binding domain-containing protein [Anaerolineae bacterium]
MSGNKLARRDFLRLSAGVGAGTILAACQPTPAPTEAPTEAPTQAAVATPVPEKGLVFGGLVKNIHPAWEVTGEGIREVLRKVGGELIWTAPEIEDVPKQREMFEGFLAQGVDAILFAASDPEAFTDLVSEAHSRGIPVVTYEADAAPSGRLAYIGGNDYRYGRVAGEAMAEKLGGKGKVAILQGSATATNARRRADGMEDALTEAGCEVVIRDVDKEDVEVSLSHCEQLMATYPDLAGFMGVYAYHISNAANAVVAAGKAGEIEISGTDPFGSAFDFIRDGTVFAAYAHELYSEGGTAAIFAYNIMTFGLHHAYYGAQIDTSLPVSERKLFMPDIKLTKDNVDGFLAYQDELLEGKWGFGIDPLE